MNKFKAISCRFDALVKWSVILFSFLLSAIQSFLVSLFLLDLEPWERWDFCKSLLWPAVFGLSLGILVGWLL